MSHVMASSIATEKISSPKNMNVYSIVISTLTSKKVNSWGWGGMGCSYGIPFTVVQLICLTSYNTEVCYLK